jgi:hypothetical protein
MRMIMTMMRLRLTEMRPTMAFVERQRFCGAEFFEIKTENF